MIITYQNITDALHAALTEYDNTIAAHTANYDPKPAANNLYNALQDLNDYIEKTAIQHHPEKEQGIKNAAIIITVTSLNHLVTYLRLDSEGKQPKATHIVDAALTILESPYVALLPEEQRDQVTAAASQLR